MKQFPVFFLFFLVTTLLFSCIGDANAQSLYCAVHESGVEFCWEPIPEHLEEEEDEELFSGQSISISRGTRGRPVRSFGDIHWR